MTRTIKGTDPNATLVSVDALGTGIEPFGNRLGTGNSFFRFPHLELFILAGTDKRSSRKIADMFGTRPVHPAIK
jgi:hypothetical protein